MMAIAEALYCDTSELVLNRSTLQHLRKQYRKEKAKENKANFHFLNMLSIVMTGILNY